MQDLRIKLKPLLLTALALACAATSAAETSVSFSGLVDNYAGSVRLAGQSGAARVVNSGGLTTSWFGFKGTEDLGGGLKANFALTSFFQADNGAIGRFPGNETMFSRDAHVGLSGRFGAVSLGRDLAPNFLPTVLFNPFGDSFSFSPLIVHADVPTFGTGPAPVWNASLAGDTGWSNEILYSTPNFGGLTANIHYQFGEVAGDNGKRNVGANLLYFRGPLALTAFYHNVKVNNPLNPAPGTLVFGSARQTAWMVGGSYDLGAAKLYATYGQTSHDIDVKDKTFSLGASVPAGHGKVLAGWARTQRSGMAADLRATRNTITVGYDYDLSKRTDLYAMLMNDRITDLNSGNSFGVGIRHRF